MRLSIIIVSWNVVDYLRRCLDAVGRAMRDEDEVIVIDNASSDGTAGMISKYFSWVTLLTNPQNLGFAKAVNQGLRLSHGDCVFLLNPDTEVKPETFDALVKFMDEHKDADIVGPKLVDPTGRIVPSVRSFPTLFSQALILLKLHHVLKFLSPLRRYFKISFDYEKEAEVDQIMGAAMCIRREVIEDIGAFDERFFLWFEEVDFCKRAKEAGWKIFFAPSIEIIDYAGQSFKKLSSLRRQIIFNRSLLAYFRKHESFSNYALLFLLQPISLSLALLSQVINVHPRVRP